MAHGAAWFTASLSGLPPSRMDRVARVGKALLRRATIQDEAADGWWARRKGRLGPAYGFWIVRLRGR
jgi:hypothetical protein